MPYVMPENDDSPGLKGRSENPLLPPLRITYTPQAEITATETSARISWARVESCTPSTDIAQATIQNAIVSQIQLMLIPCTEARTPLRKPPKARPMASVSISAPP